MLGGVAALGLTYLAMRVLEQYLHFETAFFDRRLAMLGVLFGAIMGCSAAPCRSGGICGTV